MTATPPKPATLTKPVLAIDTALGACSVALVGADGAVLAAISDPMERGHAEALAPMVQTVLARAQLKASILGRIVVTVGPGSYTGLRVGLSAARTLALVADGPCVGVSTLAALALGEAGRVLTLIDARHEHVYAGVFENGRALVAPHYAPLAEAHTLAGSVDRVVATAAPLLAGLEALSVQRNVRAAPDAAALARFGQRLDAKEHPPHPLYLKAVDAKPAKSLLTPL